MHSAVLNWTLVIYTYAHAGYRCQLHCLILFLWLPKINDNVVEAHGYGFRSTVVRGEHSRSKTSAIIAMYDVSTTRVFVRYKRCDRNVVHCNYCSPSLLLMSKINSAAHAMQVLKDTNTCVGHACIMINKVNVYCLSNPCTL